MFMQRIVSVIFLVAVLHGGSVASDVFLQLEELQGNANAAEGQARVSRSLEANVSLDSPFYIRTVADGQQWLLRGKVTKRQDGKFQVQYTLSTTELREDPAPRMEMEGSVTVQFWQANSLAPAVTKAKTEYTLTLYPFNPHIGFRDTSSGFSVRLVDEDRQPVTNAIASLYGPVSDVDGEPIIGPAKSDAEGIVRFSEGRESLPDLTFVAEHRDRSLMAVRHLNRNSVSTYLSAEPQSITLRRELKRWKRPLKLNAAEQ